MFLLPLVLVALWSTARGAGAGKGWGVPVLLLDDNGTMLEHVRPDYDALHKMGSQHFTDIIQRVKNNNEVIVVFLERVLSNEDFTLKDELGTAFPYLDTSLRANGSRYFPSVQSPAQTLLKILPPDQKNVFNVTDRHDKVMHDFYHVIKTMKTGNVTCFYTGLVNPIPLEVRAALMTSDATSVSVTHEAGLFYFANMVLISGGTKSTITAAPTVTVEEGARTEVASVISLAFEGATIKLAFGFDNINWWEVSLELMTTATPATVEAWARTGMGGPLNHSFACGDPIVFKTPGRTLYIGSFQVQPFPKKDGVASLTEFGPADLCIVILTIPILMGVFVVFIMLGIFFFGIIMVMDIRTYNRFDDPHGKSLIITFDE